MFLTKMKIMKKSKSMKIVQFILIGFLLFSLFSCESTETPESTDTTEPVVIEPVIEPVIEEEKPVEKEEIVEEPIEEVVVEDIFTLQGFFEKLSEVLNTGTVEEALALYEEVPAEYAENFDLLYGDLLLLFCLSFQILLCIHLIFLNHCYLKQYINHNLLHLQ